MSLSKGILSVKQIEQIKALGFEIRGIDEPVEDFINKRFPDFDLFAFVQRIEQFLEPLTAKKISKTIDITTSEPPSIQVEYISEDCFTDDGLAFSRTFRWEGADLVVDHGYFQLPVVERGQGKAKQLFREHVPLYQKMGVKRILVNASMKDGGLVWAKNYFVAIDRQEVDAILAKAYENLTDKQMNIIQKYYDNYYQKTPDGPGFPIVNWSVYSFMDKILRGSNWKGLMDLENPQQLSNFIRYINEEDNP